MTVDASVRYQTLAGFGATLAYTEADVLQYARKAELFEAMFANLGLDMLRLRNRYGLLNDNDLTKANQIVSAATSSLGRAPTVILTSWSPPPSLKVSGAAVCQGNADTCTLSRASDGGFDYAGFGAYWRASLDAYRSAGLFPDYIGVQNNPDFVPTAASPGEGCRFLPTEGTASVTMNGTAVTVTYPGFGQAFAAVINALAGLTSPPKIIAPEVAAIQSVAEYARVLDFAHVDAIAHHLYGSDPAAPNLTALSELNTLGRDYARPLFQTEMQSEGLGNAQLIHYAVTVEGVSAYLHSVLAGPPASLTEDPGALVAFGVDGLSLRDSYHALRHYARYTDPGWLRVQATADSTSLLVSAWISPEGNAVTAVLVNATASQIDAQLSLGELALTKSSVIRTAFDGVERSSELGSLSAEGVLRLPAHSVVTVALQK